MSLQTARQDMLAGHQLLAQGINARDRSSQGNMWLRERALSRKSSRGTGVPHLRSRVMHRSFRPSRSHASVAALQFALQPPCSHGAADSMR
jgi:hypothetical protein